MLVWERFFLKGGPTRTDPVLADIQLICEGFWTPSKLIEQWGQSFDDLVVNHSIASYQAITILYVFDVVVQRLTKKVAQSAASFGEN